MFQADAARINLYYNLCEFKKIINQHLAIRDDKHPAYKNAAACLHELTNNPSLENLNSIHQKLLSLFPDYEKAVKALVELHIKPTDTKSCEAYGKLAYQHRELLLGIIPSNHLKTAAMGDLKTAHNILRSRLSSQFVGRQHDVIDIYHAHQDHKNLIEYAKNFVIQMQLPQLLKQQDKASFSGLMAALKNSFKLVEVYEAQGGIIPPEPMPESEPEGDVAILINAHCDPYVLLGVDAKADDKTINAKHRKLALTYHPDLNGNKANFSKHFALINAAKTALIDQNMRQQVNSLIQNGKLNHKYSFDPQNELHTITFKN